MKKHTVTSGKGAYISPNFVVLSVSTFHFLCTSVKPTTTDSSEPDYKDEEEKDWGEIEF